MIDVLEMLKKKCEDYDPYSDEETSIIGAVEKDEEDVFFIIREAVLIDWLSEMHGVDYFSQDFMVPNGHGGQKRGDLIDYINAIKYIKMPEWVSEASKAHTIRQRRNLVHAKLCLNTTDINADTCDMVINYLRDVLISRGVNI